MTALRQPAPDSQIVLQLAHADLSDSFYDREVAHREYDRLHAINVARWYINNAEPAADRYPSEKAIYFYGLLRDVVEFQFHYLTELIGIEVNFTTDDPYCSSSEMLSDFYATGKLRVYRTQPGLHPVWTDDDNNRFRAVHDLLGHCAWGNSFGPKGEDAAYRSHVATLPREVLPALCSETRGQNATYNYGHLIDGRAPFQYARQSWLPSPKWVCE